MLDERKTAILHAVVREYIATAQPVGSNHVASAPGVHVSSATVRNEMAVLEQEGYLVQPHTSAGRIPTDKGYRFFVDHLASPGRLDATHTQQVREFFGSAHGALEQMLQDTSRLLTHLTDYAAVVVAPSHDTATIRSVQLVSLSPRLVMVVTVLSKGSVENEAMEVPADTSETTVNAASTHLQRHLVGQALGSVPVSVSPSGDAGVDELCQTAVRVVHKLARREGDGVFVGGAARMAEAFDAVDIVRRVLVTLEQQYVVVSLLRDVIDRGLTVAIGAEHGVEPLATCSVVVAPYSLSGTAGTIAVLGPTRMNYPHALAAVEAVSRRLGEHLAES
jgi:heat-inducible transcriptional repressor